jgi:hypothetical protein
MPSDYSKECLDIHGILRILHPFSHLRKLNFLNLSNKVPDLESIRLLVVQNQLPMKKRTLMLRSPWVSSVRLSKLHTLLS